MNQPHTALPASEERLDLRHPTGPLIPGGEGREGSLFIFAPRSPLSVMIDELSGGYGYSHVAIDCGEVDAPTGRRVMIEATIPDGVHVSYQDEYGDRPFVRIPLKKTGINVRRFCDRVRSRLGEAFDREEALTAGVIDDPARQICSDLATVCLPARVRADIARHHHAGLIHPLSVVIHGRLDRSFRLFVSPNGLAEYFGAPRGKDLAGPDRLCEPRLPDERTAPRRYVEVWKLALAAAGAGLALGWVLILLRRKGRAR